MYSLNDYPGEKVPKLEYTNVFTRLQPYTLVG